MSDFQTALRARIIGDPTVAGLVGARVYPVMVPQDAASPYVRMQVVSDPRRGHLKGDNAMRRSRVQIDCMARQADGAGGYAKARALAFAIIAALDGPADVGGVRFGRIETEGPEDLGEDTARGFVYRARVDLIVAHRII